MFFVFNRGLTITTPAAVLSATLDAHRYNLSEKVPFGFCKNIFDSSIILLLTWQDPWQIAWVSCVRLWFHDLSVCSIEVPVPQSWWSSMDVSTTSLSKCFHCHSSQKKYNCNVSSLVRGKQDHHFTLHGYPWALLMGLYWIMSSKTHQIFANARLHRSWFS